MRSVWFLLAACGCRGILGIEPPIDVPDDVADAPALCTTWHPPSVDPCALGAPAPMPTLAAGAYTYDTTDAGGTLFDAAGHAVLASGLTLPQAGGPMLAVLSIDALALDAGATIQVTGAKPLMIVAWSAIVIDGVLDASSRSGVTDEASHTVQTVQAGAGANAGCTTDLGSDGTKAADAGLGSGGGGGGALQGAGGAASTGGMTDVLGGAGGVAATPIPMQVLRGGCRGGFSGAAGVRVSLPLHPGSQSPGGAGGGAIRLVARDSISIAGSIRANGAGGAGAPTRSGCGGGGGGAGGVIELEAPIVTISGTLSANGGGGGGGGNKDEAGHDGANGTSDLVAAPGGAIAASGCGAPGGAGSGGTVLAGSTASEPDTCGGGVDGGGGGGGGGGAGLIAATSPQVAAAETATISPPLSMR